LGITPIDNEQDTKHSLSAIPVFGARHFWLKIMIVLAQNAANLFLQRLWVKMRVTCTIIAASAA
jgi:hypothetical protein